MNEGKQNFTRIPNNFLEHLATLKIPIQSLQCLSVIIRLTWGYNRKSAEIRNKYFVEFTGLNKTNVVRALNKLEDMNLIKVTPIDNKRAKRYRINYRYDLLNRDDQMLPKEITKVTNSGNQKLSGEVTKVTSRDNLTQCKSTIDSGLRRAKENLKKTNKKKLKKGDAPPSNNLLFDDGVALRNLSSNIGRPINSSFMNKLSPEQQAKRIKVLRKQGEEIMAEFDKLKNKKVSRN